MAALLALVVGVFCIIARALRLGVLATLLSRPIVTGFLAGISLSIMIGQIGRLTGVKIEAEGLIGPLLEIVDKADLIHWPSLALGAAIFLVLQAVRIRKLPIPGPVIVVVLAVALSALFDFKARGIAVVGDVPSGLPQFALPAYSGVPVDSILLGAASILLVSFGSGIVTARSFAARGGSEVDPNRELTGFGAANIAAGFFGAFPVAASDSRTAVNMTVGGRTQVASIVAAAALVAMLLFLGPVLRILPIPALGAILVAAALSLIDVEALGAIRRISRVEFLFAIIALMGPLGLGVLQGIVIAVGATLVYLLYKAAHPRDALLGRIPGRDGFYKLHRSPGAPTRARPRTLHHSGQPVVLRHRLCQGAAAHHRVRTPARHRVVRAGRKRGRTGRQHCRRDARGDRRRVRRARPHPRFRRGPHRSSRLLERAGVIDRIGTTMVFDDLDDALRAVRVRSSFSHNTEPI